MDLTTFLTAGLFAILPALFWLSLYYHKDYRDKEPKAIILQTFLAGIVAGIPFLILRHVMMLIDIQSLFFQGAMSVILFALLEEMAKLSAAIFIVTRHKMDFNQIIDGVIYAISAALGFAFIENMFYISSFLMSNSDMADLAYFVAFRSFGTMLAHTFFSGIAGLIWAYAYFSTQISPFQQKHILAFELKDFINHEILSLHIIRNNILKARPSRRGGHEKKILVLEGVILTSLLHMLFNYLTTVEVFNTNLSFLLVPLIMIGFLYISYLFTKKLNQKILKVV